MGELGGQSSWESWMGRFKGKEDGEGCLGRFIAELDGRGVWGGSWQTGRRLPRCSDPPWCRGKSLHGSFGRAAVDLSV